MQSGNFLEEYRYLYCEIKKQSIKERRNIMEDLLTEYEFNERFLQIIWNEQYLVNELESTNGKKLKIISSGTWNRGAGPDFLNGKIQIGEETRIGSIEIHRRSSDWYRHGHKGDERYENVILHAVWENDLKENINGIETLEIRGYIPEEWRLLLWEMEESRYSYAREIQRGGCALRWAMSEDDTLLRLLESAGMARFGWKTRAIQKKISEIGVERGVLLFLMESLGYKSNRLQFRQLAGNLDLELLKSGKYSRIEKEAHIFGCAGMLPDTTRDSVLQENMEYVKMLWDSWWKNGTGGRTEIAWSRAGCRPYNNPWRRVAAAVEILAKTGYRPSEWLKNQAMKCSTPKELLKEIFCLNNTESIWRAMIDFSRKAVPAADLLGRNRLLDITGNALLPALAAIGEMEKMPDLSRLAKDTFLMLPTGETNSLLKEAAARFLTPPGRVHEIAKRSCHQQGLLDIYKNFCMALENDCLKCPFMNQ